MKLNTDLLSSAKLRGDQHMIEWATIVSVNSLLPLQKLNEAIQVLEDSEQWMNKQVATTDPAKMVTFYAAFTLALVRGGRRTDAILAR
jgi:hypothetical protein